MKSAPMNLPGKNAINALMGLGTAGAGALVMSTGDPALGLAALGGTAALSSMAGWCVRRSGLRASGLLTPSSLAGT